MAALLAIAGEKAHSLGETVGRDDAHAVGFSFRTAPMMRARCRDCQGRTLDKAGRGAYKGSTRRIPIGSKESSYAHSGPTYPGHPDCHRPRVDAPAGPRRRRQADPLAAQDLHPSRRQDPRHHDSGLRQADRCRRPDPDLHLRRHVDQVHGRHREQDATRCGGARFGGAGAPREPGSAVRRVRPRRHRDQGAGRARAERRGRRQVRRQVLCGAPLHDSSHSLLQERHPREGRRPASRYVGGDQRDLGYDPAMSLLWSYGAAWVDKSGKYVGMPKDKAVQAIKVVTPAFLTDKTSAFDFLSWSGSGNNEAFMAGKIAFTPNGPSILFQEDSTKHPLRKDTAIKMMPRGPAGRNLALTFVMNWAVPVDGKQQKEARALVACLMSKDKVSAYMTGSFQQAVPPYKNLINHEYWNFVDDTVTTETVKLGRPVGWPGPTTPAAAEVISSNVLTDMMTRVIVDKVTPEKAVEEADKRIKEIYDRLPVK